MITFLALLMLGADLSGPKEIKYEGVGKFVVDNLTPEETVLLFDIDPKPGQVSMPAYEIVGNAVVLGGQKGNYRIRAVIVDFAQKKASTLEQWTAIVGDSVPTPNPNPTPNPTPTPTPSPVFPDDTYLIASKLYEWANVSIVASATRAAEAKALASAMRKTAEKINDGTITGPAAMLQLLNENITLLMPDGAARARWQGFNQFWGQYSMTLQTSGRITKMPEWAKYLVDSARGLEAVTNGSGF